MIYYWISKFSNRGYFFDNQKTNKFKELIEPYRRKKGLSGYCNNTMIFIK